MESVDANLTNQVSRSADSFVIAESSVLRMKPIGENLPDSGSSRPLCVVMKTIIFSLVLLCAACSNPKVKSDSIPTNYKTGPYHKIVFPFRDSILYVSVEIFDTTLTGFQDKPNAVISYFSRNSQGGNTLKSDSVWVKSLPTSEDFFYIFRKDMNFDAQDDILISAGYDGRMNVGYHLYLVDTTTKTITKVQDFEQVGNPESDASSHLIESWVLSSKPFCSFYSISKSGRLIELKASMEVENSNFDSIEFSKIKRQAIKELESSR